jgi:hypothetical protein
MRAFFFGITLIIDCIVNLSADAQQSRDTARFMLPYCKQTHRHDLSFAGACMGTVTTYWQFADKLPENSKSCPPGNMSREDLVGVVVRYMERNPAELDQLFIIVVVDAFQEQWPCPK